MESINNFLSGNRGQNNFVPFNKVHFLLLSVSVIGIIYMLIKKDKSRKSELIIGSVLVFQQISLYSWYFTSRYNVLREGLPLYHCRVAILLLGLGLIFNSDIFMKIGSSWGIFGSISALLLPNLDPFTFPHITQFSFFIGHIFLLWGSVYILYVKNLGMSKSDLKILLIFSNVYHVLMFVFNNQIGSNYGYMKYPPIEVLSSLNPYVYSLGVIICFNIAILIQYTLINRNLSNNNFYSEDDNLENYMEKCS